MGHILRTDMMNDSHDLLNQAIKPDELWRNLGKLILTITLLFTLSNYRVKNTENENL